VDLERVLDDLLGDLVKAGFDCGRIKKAIRRGDRAARRRTLEALITFRAFLGNCPEACVNLKFTGGPAGDARTPGDSPVTRADGVRARGEVLSQRGPEVALEEVFRQVGRTADSVASGHGGPPPVRVWHGDQWVSCSVRDAPDGPAGTMIFGAVDGPTLVCGGLDIVHPADHVMAAGEATRLAGKTGELGSDWLEMRGGSDGSEQQDDPPEGPAAGGHG
jgi:hypothetical protein